MNVQGPDSFPPSPSPSPQSTPSSGVSSRPPSPRLSKDQFDYNLDVLSKLGEEIKANTNFSLKSESGFLVRSDGWTWALRYVQSEYTERLSKIVLRII